MSGNQLTNDSYIKLLEYQYEDHITDFTMPNYDRNFEKQNNFGYIAMVKDMSSLKYKHQYARSRPILIKKIDEGYEYYTPNLFYTNKSRCKTKLRWMMGFTFDFDEEHLFELGISSEAGLITHIEGFGFQVCALVATPSGGYHVYMPLKPLRGFWNGESTIKRYDRLIKKIARLIGSDLHAASAEHYFRLPRKDNVLYFKPLQKPSIDDYETILNTFECNKKTTVRENVIRSGKIMSSKAMVQLFMGKFKSKTSWKGRKLGRNNAAFTLALGYKLDGLSKEEATLVLGKWYERINHEDFTWDEVRNCINHAYSGNYQKVSWSIVYALTGIWIGPSTPRKERTERKDHFYEIEADLLSFLERSVIENGESPCMSQDELAKVLQVKKRSLEYIISKLKVEGRLNIEKVRIGRSFVSKYLITESAQISSNEAEVECLQDNLVNIDIYKNSKSRKVRKMPRTSPNIHSAHRKEPIFCANDYGFKKQFSNHPSAEKKPVRSNEASGSPNDRVIDYAEPPPLI
ncbi:hypothetical protein GE107_21440 [Cohnella sp. CFH 77786]|uniref:hypothetical protein n=1 Tax=Cohnella sp. CFH 77786 TaxID=2662265 RepID=UPI001C60ACDD|nr:hypothetical protein [Cohnella sp. CFH 77786]MBW5448614.1 hypothetical protein [Cohnella sp. CFH 77786]